MKNILCFFGFLYCLMLAAHDSYGINDEIATKPVTDSVIQKLNSALAVGRSVCSNTTIFSFCRRKSLAVVFCIRILSEMCGIDRKYDRLNATHLSVTTAENLYQTIARYADSEDDKKQYFISFLKDLSSKKKLNCDMNAIIQTITFQSKGDVFYFLNEIVETCNNLNNDTSILENTAYSTMHFIYALNNGGDFSEYDSFKLIQFKSFLDQLLPTYSPCNLQKIEYDCYPVNDQLAKICFFGSGNVCVEYGKSKKIEIFNVTDRDVLKLYFYVQERRMDLMISDHINTIAIFQKPADNQNCKEYMEIFCMNNLKVKRPNSDAFKSITTNCQKNSSYCKENVTELKDLSKCKGSLTGACTSVNIDIELLSEKVIEDMSTRIRENHKV